MVFNFTLDFQFVSRPSIEDVILEIIEETKLLGVIVTNDLTWNKNTQNLVKRANARLRLLHRLSEFEVPIQDLIQIYILFIRSVLEQSCPVWHSSLTEENAHDLERVQKSALRIILKERYTTYVDAWMNTSQ